MNTMNPYITRESREAVQELIETCERLCDRLSDMAKQEQFFCDQLCEGFDYMSYKAYSMANEIRHTADRFGVC